MFKKLMLSAVLATGLATVSTGALASNDVQADLCFSHITGYDAKFQCFKLFDKQFLTIDEISKRGYRLVSMEAMPRSLLIAIEKK